MPLLEVTPINVIVDQHEVLIALDQIRLLIWFFIGSSIGSIFFLYWRR